MTLFYRNVSLGLAWIIFFSLMIASHTSQMFLAMLFTVFVLHFSENLTGKYITRNKSQKFIALILSALIISLISFALYKSVMFMWGDLNELIQKSQPLIIESLHKLGLEKNVQTISELYNIVVEFIKVNVGVITFSAGLLLKVFIGILLGIVVHFSIIEEANDSNAWGNIMNKMLAQANVMYNSFRDIMGIQVVISLMNTTIISVMALGLTYFIYGQFLPYWYVIIPLTAILSLVPVVGNLMVNIILVLSTVQISPTYVLVGVGLFLVIHKLELIVIGKKMKEKVNIPFILILLSMLLGEMLFHSMSGMILGMVLMVTISTLLKDMEMINVPSERPAMIEKS